MTWLSFIELDKAVVHVIRLASYLWLRFQSVCPLMPSLSSYCLVGLSLTLDMWYLFMAAPAKHSHCSLPWTWGISFWALAAPAPLCCCKWQNSIPFLGWVIFHCRYLLCACVSLLNVSLCSSILFPGSVTSLITNGSNSFFLVNYLSLFH